MKREIMILLSFLLLLPIIYGLNFDLDVSNTYESGAYRGDMIEVKGTIVNNDEICDISCDWSTSSSTRGEGIKVVHGGMTDFYFNVKAEGSEGIGDYIISLECSTIQAKICVPEKEKKTVGPIEFLFNDDKRETIEDSEKQSNGITGFVVDEVPNVLSDIPKSYKAGFLVALGLFIIIGIVTSSGFQNMYFKPDKDVEIRRCSKCNKKLSPGRKVCAFCGKKQ